MVLKILHLTRAQWDELPWHDQRMYIEQMNQDPEYADDDNPDGNQTGPEQDISDWDDLPEDT